MFGQKTYRYPLMSETRGLVFFGFWGFYVFPNCSGVLGKKTPKGKIINSDQDYCDYLLEEGLVAAVPGVAFGLSPYFRISYATSDQNLKKAIQRIEKVTNELT